MVWDEPLYAYYLAQTKLEHPGRDEILATYPNHWQSIAEQALAPLPDEARVFYQKHMAHHLLPEVERDWLLKLEHAFLLRDPRAMLASYVKKRGESDLSARELGLPQQVELFNYLQEHTGKKPLVINARQVLESPRAALTALCTALGLDFDEAMLSWPAGRRESDGCWAPYWYDSVERSTGFAPYREAKLDLSPELESIADECMPYYHTLSVHAIDL